MALSSLGMSFILADVVLRRLLLPFVLLSAVIFRYNLFSFVYLLLFIVSLLLPGPRLKSQKASNVVFLSILLIFSAVATLGQSLFQITLATDYSLSPCEEDESTWRQVGFVQFNIPAVDVVRLLLPDVVVFLATLLTLCVNVKVITIKSSSTREEVEERGKETVTMTTGDGNQQDSDRERDLSGSELEDPSREPAPPFDKTVQCYWRIPKLVVYCLELAMFVALGLSGIAVPSLLSFIYYAVFLLVLIIWSLHMRLKVLVRAIRAVLVLYSALHLLLLDLYQFPSAQTHIEIEPTNTTQSLLARLFGLTPLIFTDCERPTELLLTPDQHYISYLSPVFILMLFWIVATDLRMWLFTPKLLWRKHGAYFLPIVDSRPSSSVFCIVNQGSHRQKLWSSYGAIQHEDRGGLETSPATLSTDTSSPSPVESLDIDEVPTTASGVPRRRHIRKMSFKDIWHKIKRIGVILWGACLSVSYIFAIICMMLWSVLYPSWPSLVFLLWSCVIWLIPRINPKNSLYFTSPLLVLYALVLLILQYIYSLEINGDELSRRFDVITECSSGTLVGCKSWVLLAKTLLTVVFFAAFHESVHIFKQWWKEKRQQTQYNHTDDATDSEERGKSTASTTRAKIYDSVYRLLCSYWILVVIGAFLLVMLTGDPSLLKSVYMVFFFLFLVTYQVTENFWFYLSFPVWCLLVLYSALELVLVYTYQFDVVSDGWLRLYNMTHLENESISAEELYDSIGLRKYDINALRNLLVSLIPPAIFIAVLAMQLRYFRPLRQSASATSQESGLSALDLKNLLPAAIRKRVNTWEGEEEESNGDKEPAVTAESNATDQKTQSSSLVRQRTISSSSDSKAYMCYRFTLYIFQKSRELIVDLFNLSWRFLELHMHKIIVLVLFASTLTQISAIYWLLLLCIVIILPLPYFNPLSYPLLTLYLGVVSTMKMLYQVPLIQENYFNFSESSNCNATMTTPGLVYNETYSPRTGSANWIGLHKTNNFASYIWVPIVSSLLLSLWFAARRSQAHYYHSKGIRVEPYETGSLFLSVTRQDAETSIISAIKYVINHFFEMYGVEVCWSMLAITVAVRVDVYGPVYGIILGLLLFTPRSVLAPVWMIILLVHGALLLVQYFFLLGGPPGFCLARGDTNVYAWSNITPAALKKWLFLTDDVSQVLDKNLLYADFIFYILVCLQIRYFRSSPLRKGTPEQVNGALHNFLQLQYFLDYVKYIIFQYSFWVSLFLMFFTAASRVSLFGLLYLLVGFFFLYRGMDMLKDKQRTRHFSWAILRLITLAILFVRVSLQVIDCAQLVDWKAEGNERIDCILILLFNGACIKQQYYGSPEVSCSSGPNSTGLWVDALNFVVITLQIIIFDTQYSEIVKVDVLRKQSTAKSFRDVFDHKVTEIQEANQEKLERELLELKERAAELKLTENRIDHILYAGVQIPEDITVRQLRKRTDTTTSESDAYFGIEDSDSIAGDIPKSKVSGEADENEEEKKEEKKALVKAWNQFVSLLNQALDMFIDWLESTSYLYRTVVSEVGQESGSSPSETGLESAPFATDNVESYGTIETRKPDDEPPDEDTSDGVKPPTTTTVEVYHEPSRQPSESSYSAAVSEGSVLKDEEVTSSRPPGSGRAGPVMIDTRGDVLLEELRVAPTEEEEEDIREFEGELEERAKKYSYKLRRLIVALYYAFLSHSEYVVFFFIILNVILNGSLLSLVYVVLLFTWGLLSIPWPSKRFWLILIFYTMIVLTVKYGFQFQEIEYWAKFDQRSGLYPPRLIGILFRENFFTNAAWDMLLLIALLIHRGLLKEYGLWTSRSVITTNTFFQVVWNDFKGFFKRVVSKVITQGAKDYYMAMLFFDILCFVTIILGVNSFGVGFGRGGGNIAAVTAVADFVRSNYIPLGFLIILLLQFLSMLVDRAIYIRHSLIGKVIFYFILLIGWHVGLFFILPSNLVTGRPFSENPAAQCIYFFKCCYFIVSALQIVAGYPTRTSGYFLAKAYNTISWLAFLGYRLIPLLPELREVVDWAFTDTSLSLINWFKVQEIYAQLYLVEVQRRREMNSPRQLGAKQTWLIKIALGFTLILALVLLLWLPLLIISISGTANEANPPVEVGIQVILGGSQPLLRIEVQSENITQLNRTQYDTLLGTLQDRTLVPLIKREIGSEDFSQVVFPGGSTSLWSISPDARNRLFDRLIEVRENPNISIPIEFSWTITRNPSSGLALESVSGRTRRELRYTTDNSTIDEFIDSLLESEENFNVSVPNLYPSIVTAPSNDVSKNYTQLTGLMNSSLVNVSCSLLLNRTEGSTDEWWSLFQESPDPIIPFEGPGLELIVYSERIAQPLFSAIVGIGIIGLYGSVVIVIGQLIRGYISNLPSHLIVDEILNPEPLLKLCKDIFLVRENKNFLLEEMLVGKLFFIYRSPERIVKLTENTNYKKLKQE